MAEYVLKLPDVGEGMTEYTLDGKRIGYGLSEYLDQLRTRDRNLQSEIQRLTLSSRPVGNPLAATP